MLPPLMSYSLAPSSTMMSCTVHGPMDSLMQPSCIVVYSVQSSTRRLPIRALFGFTLKLVKSYLSFPSEPCVVVCPWYQPWVASSTRRLPIQALFGFMLKQSSPIPPFPSESLSVVVHPRFTLGRLNPTTAASKQN